LLQGRAGRLRSDYHVEIAEHGLAELAVRVRGRADDRIELNDHIRLNGTVDQTQLETLMAHGLTSDQAIELVISGMLRTAPTGSA